MLVIGLQQMGVGGGSHPDICKAPVLICECYRSKFKWFIPPIFIFLSAKVIQSRSVSCFSNRFVLKRYRTLEIGRAEGETEANKLMQLVCNL